MSLLDRTQPPAFHPVGNIHLARAQSDHLANGLPRHVLRGGSQPVVGVELVFPAGIWQESDRGASFLLSKVLAEGTRRRSGADVQEAFSRYGTFLQVTHGADDFTVALYTLRRFLPDVLPLLVEVLREATLPDEELENQRQIQQQTLRVNLRKTGFVAGRTLRSLLFGAGHPYGPGPEPDELETLTRDQVAAHYEARVQPLDAELILAGDVTDEVLRLTDDTLGQVARTPAPAPPLVPPTPPAARRQETAVFPAGKQSSIRAGRHLFTRHHPDVFRFKVLNEIFGGYFGSRLMKNIREEKGYTYGIGSGYAALRHAGYWTIGTDVKKEATEATFAEIYNEMHRLREEPVPADELETVRNYMLGTLAGAITTPFELADKFKAIHFGGVGYDYYDTLVATIRGVTSDHLQETARRYFDPDALFEAVAGAR